MQRALAMADARGPIAIEWVPADFPDRVNLRSAGPDGAATQAEVPTGVALAGRIDELLGAAVGVSAGADTVLTIFVFEARTEYVNNVDLDRHVSGAWCVFDAEFDAGGEHWPERFEAKARGDARGSGPIDRVWDDIALQVVASVIERLPLGAERASGTSPAAERVPDTSSAPLGVVTVSANVETADIFVDGRFVGAPPAVLRLAPGDYLIEVRADGRPRYRRELHVLEASEQVIRADLRP
jgi:hypothetical protein